jgi:hypothetical protein
MNRLSKKRFNSTIIINHFIPISLLSVFLIGCNSTKKDVQTAETDTVWSENIDSEEYEKEERGPYKYIRNNWQPQKVEYSSKNKLPNVKDFFNVYFSYFKNKKDFRFKDNMNLDSSEITIDKKNGYLRYDDPFEIWQCCIWNRNNGHILIAVDWYHETDGWGSALCFYDYNPQTKLMSMEETLTDKFREKTTEVCDNYGDFMKLPQKGKDIHLMNPELSFKWNGYDFDFPK